MLFTHYQQSYKVIVGY